MNQQTMVRKGYLVDNHSDFPPERIIVDEYGMMFSRNSYGWRSPSKYDRLVLFPDAIPFGSSPDRNDWSWSGWWEKNWNCSSWSWIHMEERKDT